MDCNGRHAVWIQSSHPCTVYWWWEAIYGWGSPTCAPPTGRLGRQMSPFLSWCSSMIIWWYKIIQIYRYSTTGRQASEIGHVFLSVLRTLTLKAPKLDFTPSCWCLFLPMWMTRFTVKFQAGRPRCVMMALLQKISEGCAISHPADIIQWRENTSSRPLEHTPFPSYLGQVQKDFQSFEGRRLYNLLQVY